MKKKFIETKQVVNVGEIHDELYSMVRDMQYVEYCIMSQVTLYALLKELSKTTKPKGNLVEVFGLKVAVCNHLDFGIFELK